jgi:hypothetical protein
MTAVEYGASESPAKPSPENGVIVVNPQTREHVRENSFVAPAIKLQTERGHRVISSGPYAFVRHPMYSGTVLFFVGAPLLLGSWWGIALFTAVRRAVRLAHRHRGTRGARGPARLCRLCGASALPAGARTSVRVILHPT